MITCGDLEIQASPFTNYTKISGWDPGILSLPNSAGVSSVCWVPGPPWDGGCPPRCALASPGALYLPRLHSKSVRPGPGSSRSLSFPSDSRVQPALGTTCPRGSGKDPKDVTAEPALLSGNLRWARDFSAIVQSRSKCGSQVSSIFSLSLPLYVTWSQFNKGSVAPGRSSLSTHGLRLSSAVTSPSCVCLSPALFSHLASVSSQWNTATHSNMEERWKHDAKRKPDSKDYVFVWVCLCEISRKDIYRERKIHGCIGLGVGTGIGTGYREVMGMF